MHFLKKIPSNKNRRDANPKSFDKDIDLSFLPKEVHSDFKKLLNLPDMPKYLLTVLVEIIQEHLKLNKREMLSPAEYKIAHKVRLAIKFYQSVKGSKKNYSKNDYLDFVVAALLHNDSIEDIESIIHNFTFYNRNKHNLRMRKFSFLGAKEFLNRYRAFYNDINNNFFSVRHQYKRFALMLYQKYGELICLFGIEDKVDAINAMAESELSKGQSKKELETAIEYMQLFSFLAEFLNKELQVVTKELDVAALKLTEAYFKKTQPKNVKKVHEFLYEKYTDPKTLEKLFQDITIQLSRLEMVKKIKGKIYGRIKPLPSILRKLSERNVDDILAFTVVIPNIKTKSTRVNKKTKKFTREHLNYLKEHFVNIQQEVLSFLELSIVKDSNFSYIRGENRNYVVKGYYKKEIMVKNESGESVAKSISIEIQYMTEDMFNHNEFGEGAHLGYRHGKEINLFQNNLCLMRFDSKIESIRHDVMPNSLRHKDWALIIDFKQGEVFLSIVERFFKRVDIEILERLRLKKLHESNIGEQESFVPFSWNSLLVPGMIFEISKEGKVAVPKNIQDQLKKIKEPAQFNGQNAKNDNRGNKKKKKGKNKKRKK